MLNDPQTILAYIDPGSGGLLLQFLIAAAIGVCIAFRQGLRAIALVTGLNAIASENHQAA